MAKKAFVTAGTVGQAEIAAYFDEPTIRTPEVMDVFAASYRCDDARARREFGYRSSTLREMVSDSDTWLGDEGLLCTNAGVLHRANDP
jgi:hypothetical protein